MNGKILLVESDSKIRDFIKDLLVENYFQVETVNNGSELIDYLKENEVELIVLDIDLKDIKGDYLCQKVTRLFPDTNIILITPHTEEVAHLNKFFRMGIEDYIKKPINTEDLLVRVKARIDSVQHSGDSLSIGPLHIDDKKKIVCYEGESIKLSPLEYSLLKYLVMNKDRVVSRDMILNNVWDNTAYVNPRNVDVYIGYLRKKLKRKEKKNPIKTVRGFGYRILSV